MFGIMSMDRAIELGNKEQKLDFYKQFILSRTSHKKSIDELIQDADKAWSHIQSL